MEGDVELATVLWTFGGVVVGFVAGEVFLWWFDQRGPR